jgi:hypothetical protein
VSTPEALDFPAGVDQVPRFIQALSRECARPQHGKVGGLIALAEALRGREKPITDGLPWATFSDEDLLACMGDFAIFRAALERTEPDRRSPPRMLPYAPHPTLSSVATSSGHRKGLAGG